MDSHGAFIMLKNTVHLSLDHNTYLDRQSFEGQP